MNTQKEILSFSEYIKYIEENYSRNSLFRGLKDKSFALIPKIGRDNYLRKCFEDKVVSLDKLQDLEEQTMNEFVKMSVPHLDLRAMNQWDQWTIGNTTVCQRDFWIGRKTH